MLPITILFLLAISISAFIRLLNLWFNSKFVAIVGSDISSKIYGIFLKKRYEFHINNNTSKLISNLTENVSGTVTFLNSLLLLGTAIFISLGILITIFSIDWLLAISTIGTISIAYFLLGKSTQKN